MLLNFIYFLPYLVSHITYHNLHAKTSFYDHSALLELIYLNSVNIIKPQQVRSQTFRVNDLLLQERTSFLDLGVIPKI
jgi:hypothetical protein